MPRIASPPLAAPHRQVDLGLLQAVNRFAARTGWLHGVVRTYATAGIVLFALLLLGGWWVSRPQSNAQLAAALWAGAAGLVAVAVNQPLVAFFSEARPYAADPALLVLADRSTDPSFPSDHATLVGAIAAVLWLVDRRLAIVATVGALAMAAARVYTAAHYPHDVAAGLLLGAAMGLVGWFALRRPLTALVGRLRGTPLRPLLAAGEPATRG